MMNTYDAALASARRATTVTVEAATPARYTKALQMAQTVSKRLMWEAKRDVLLAVMRRFLHDAYEVTPAGRWLNVATDGRIDVPAPWAKHTHNRWGMRRSDAELLRLLLVRAQNAHIKGAPVPLVFYAPDSRRWYLNVPGYSTLGEALGYVERTLAIVWTWEALVEADSLLERRSPMGEKRAGGKGQTETQPQAAIGSPRAQG